MLLHRTASTGFYYFWSYRNQGISAIFRQACITENPKPCSIYIYYMSTAIKESNYILYFFVFTKKNRVIECSFLSVI